MALFPDPFGTLLGLQNALEASRRSDWLQSSPSAAAIGSREGHRCQICKADDRFIDSGPNGQKRYRHIHFRSSASRA